MVVGELRITSDLVLGDVGASDKRFVGRFVAPLAGIDGQLVPLGRLGIIGLSARRIASEQYYQRRGGKD